MANDKKLVSSGKPKIGGAISVAPVGSTIPTDATAQLDAAFKSLGYVSEDGLKNGRSISTTSQKAWGGDNVLTQTVLDEDTFTFTLIESLNEEVLKTVFGAENVKGTLTSGMTIDVGNVDLPPQAWCIEIIMTDGVLKRIVIPSGKITDFGEVEYVDDNVVGYEVTITCEPNAEGKTHHEYLKKGGA